MGIGYVAFEKPPLVGPENPREEMLPQNLGVRGKWGD